VASPAKASGRKTDSENAMPFEKALKNLETIVESMEDGELPLESLLEKYEEGTRLVRTCQSKLEEAELKIKKLETDASGAMAVQPLDARTETPLNDD
jgi:exodeoxyribonuclease VII small subunit